MCREPGSDGARVKGERPDGDDWRPAAGLAALRRRAEYLAAIRRFFAARDVIEVETPLLARAGVTDVAIEGLREAATGRWLQTSPEYAMKRLLAAGLGDCYQITRAFRAGEQGRLHNPEFTLLEWYRLGWDGSGLMAEVAALVDGILGPLSVTQCTYRDAFLAAGLPDPIAAEDAALRQAAEQRLAGVLPEGLGRAGYLDLLLDGVVVPTLPARCFLTRYPADQAVLARLDADDPRVAARFELFCEGVEIANGFVELTDAQALRSRFEADQAARAAAGVAVPAVDERLLAALESGLPDCAGVALGLDRLLMLAEGARSLDAVIAFPWEQA